MSAFEIRPANPNDLPRLMALDHSCASDYVWQLELRREPNQTTANFREVRLPRSVDVKYPRNPFALADEWTKRDAVFVALSNNEPIGYATLAEKHVSSIAWVVDLVVAPQFRRQGAASTLLNTGQTWAVERGARRLVMEMQSKNQACIRLAQKMGFEFCGYNDQYYPTQDVALFFGRAIK